MMNLLCGVRGYQELSAVGYQPSATSLYDSQQPTANDRRLFRNRLGFFNFAEALKKLRLSPRSVRRGTAIAVRKCQPRFFGPRPLGARIGEGKGYNCGADCFFPSLDDASMDDPKPREYTRDEYSPDDDYPEPDPRPEPQPAPRSAPDQPAHRYDLHQLRLTRLLWVLAILLILLVGPWVIQRFVYSYTYAREQARVQAATEGLGELDLTALGTASRLVAQKVGPSVVSIRTIQIIDNYQASDEWAFLLPHHRREARGEGSGVIVDQSGYIVTNAHVVSGASQISVQLADGRSMPGEVVGADVLTDIAVVKIEADNKLVPAPWGESEEVEVGDLVWALGSPYGLERTVTFGIVSAKGRRGVTESVYQDFLQTDAAVNPGNSGGPLVNIEGEVIGINTAIVGSAYQGISFAIPSSIALKVYERIKETGRVARGWLGVALRELTPELAKKLNLETTKGVIVAGVVPDSPAEEAGLQVGDVIVAWDDQPTPDPITLSRLVAGTKIDSTAHITILRDGKKSSLQVHVGERPALRRQ
jgi:serine protease Do